MVFGWCGLALMNDEFPAVAGGMIGLLITGDDASSVMIAGRSLAAATGDQWQDFAAYLGAIGAFFAGSFTISNLTFGPFGDWLTHFVTPDNLCDSRTYRAKSHYGNVQTLISQSACARRRYKSRRRLRGHQS